MFSVSYLIVSGLHNYLSLIPAPSFPLSYQRRASSQLPVFISPPARRAFLGTVDDLSREAMIKILSAKSRGAQISIGMLRRDRALMDRCDVARGALAGLAELNLEKV